MSPTIQDPPPLHELAPGLRLARGGPGRSLNVYLLGDVVVDARGALEPPPPRPPARRP